MTRIGRYRTEELKISFFLFFFMGWDFWSHFFASRELRGG